MKEFAEPPLHVPTRTPMHIAPALSVLADLYIIVIVMLLSSSYNTSPSL